MRLVRAHRWLGGWLALAALALQLGLSFGHIHAEDLAPVASIHALAGAHGGAAPGQDHQGHDHDDCPICAAIALLATLVIPPPPALDLPNVSVIVLRDELTRPQTPGTPLRPFQARAPPNA